MHKTTAKENWVQNNLEFTEKDFSSMKQFLVKRSFPSSETVIHILLNLGLKTDYEVDQFFSPSLNHLHDPFLMTDVKKTVDRIRSAMDNQETILIYGDYDADGVTSISVLSKAFEMIGYHVDTYAPNRFKDGYGLNENRVYEFAQNHHYDVIISCDAGIRNFKTASLVKDLDVDLIITDHHEPVIIDSSDNDQSALDDGAIEETVGNRKIYLPDAYAVINPKRLGDRYPNNNLAGVGVSFKLMWALYKEVGAKMENILYLLDYVAVGTVADLVPQVHDNHGETDVNMENRSLTHFGLSLINQKPSLWVKNFSLASGVVKDPDPINFFNVGEVVNSETIGFQFGPLLNAAGRLYDPSPAVESLIASDEESSLELTQDLVSINEERKEMTKTSSDTSIRLLSNLPVERTDYGIVLFSDDFPTGIAGLIAERIKSHYYRPTIALGPSVEEDGTEVMKGSARSIPGVNVLECLDYVRSKMGDYKYGGHAEAAGMTILKSNYEDFIHFFREACSRYDSDYFVKTFHFDYEINFSEITDNFLSTLSKLEPHGIGNPKPTFYMRNVSLKNIRLSRTGRSTLLELEQDGIKIKGVSFQAMNNLIDAFDNANRSSINSLINDLSNPSALKSDEKRDLKVELIGSPKYNTFMGQTTVQIFVDHMREM